MSALKTAKAESVDAQGQPDGWKPMAGFVRDVGAQGRTQLVVSAPTGFLLDIHLQLVGELQAPLGFLYRQVVDRRDPGPVGGPARDFVALELTHTLVRETLIKYSDLFHHDARCEIYVRGALGEQIVLDQDGMLFCQPADPVFEDTLLASGFIADISTTIADRDYVKHWFHHRNDALEDELIANLGLVEVANRG